MYKQEYSFLNKSNNKILSDFLRLPDTPDGRGSYVQRCHKQLMEGNITQELFQMILREAWTGNHFVLYDMSWGDRYRMFQDAGFETPKVEVGYKIYRGLSLPKEYEDWEVEDAVINGGISWTASKETAIGFAKNRVTTFGTSRIPVDTGKYNSWLASIEVLSDNYEDNQFMACFGDRSEEEIIFTRFSDKHLKLNIEKVS